MEEASRIISNIADIFFKLSPLTLFEYVAKMFQKYAHEDWVVYVDYIDRDGDIGKRGKMETIQIWR